MYCISQRKLLHSHCMWFPSYGGGTQLYGVPQMRGLQMMVHQNMLWIWYLHHFILTVVATWLFCKVRTHWKCFSLPVFVSKYLISHTIKTFSQLVDIVYHQLFQNGMVCWFWCHFTWVQLICCSRYLNRQAPAVPDVQRVNQFMIAGWRNHASDILYTPPSPISLPLSTNPSLGLAQLQ